MTANGFGLNQLKKTFVHFKKLNMKTLLRHIATLNKYDIALILLSSSAVGLIYILIHTI